MEQELNDNKLSINPYFYTQQLCQSLEQEIKELFCNHFALNPRNFSIVYDDYAGLINYSQTSTTGNNNKSSSRVVQKMVNHAKMNSKSTENTTELEMIPMRDQEITTAVVKVTEFEK